MDSFGAYQAAAQSVRKTLIHRWNTTQDYHTEKDAKRIYYLSLEFLIGRSLNNAVLNMDIKGPYKGILIRNLQRPFDQ
jgi:starch phosphorylase